MKAMAKQLAQDPERCAPTTSYSNRPSVAAECTETPCSHSSPLDHSTQQVAQLLMQCLAKSQAKQNFSNMDQTVLRQKYDEMQSKCQEFKVCSMMRAM